MSNYEIKHSFPNITKDFSPQFNSIVYLGYIMLSKHCLYIIIKCFSGIKYSFFLNDTATKTVTCMDEHLTQILAFLQKGKLGND